MRNNGGSVNTFLSLSQLSLMLLSWEETGKRHKYEEGWSDGPIAAAGPSELWEGVGHPLLWIILSSWWQWCANSSLLVNMTSQCTVCVIFPFFFFQIRQTLSSFIPCKMCNSLIIIAHPIYVLHSVGNKFYLYRESHPWKFYSWEVLRGLELPKYLESGTSIGTDLRVS